MVEAYQRRLDEIDARLSEPARALARTVSLHDAFIEHVRWHPASKELTLSLVAEGSSGGRTVTLTYRGALIHGRNGMDILRAVARDRETEILYDEVDIDDDDGRLLHRVLFWPRDELTIDFDELRLEVTPRDDFRVYLRGAFVEVDDAPDPE